MELLDIRDALARIRLEFTHMPELRITRAQIGRLLSLAPDTCEVALGALVHSGFLERTGEGHFRRRTGARAATPRESRNSELGIRN
jgi:hypothetical protein